MLDAGHYYHVDLLRCSELGGYREFTDQEMSGYVWDYTAYPECPAASAAPAAETGAAYGGVLYVDSLSEADGPVPTYLDLLRVTSETIVKGLSQ